MNNNVKLTLTAVVAVLVGLVVGLSVTALRPQPSNLGGTTNLDSLTLSGTLTAAAVTNTGLLTQSGSVTITGDTTIASGTITQLTIGTSTTILAKKCTSVIFDPPSLTVGSSFGVDVALSGVSPSSSQILSSAFTTNATTSYMVTAASASSTNVANVIITNPSSSLGSTKNPQQGTLNVCVETFGS